MSDFVVLCMMNTIRAEVERLADLCGLGAPTVTGKPGTEHETSHHSIIVGTDPLDHAKPDSEEALKLARHLFGHFLCDLHASGGEASDQVADLIAGWLAINAPS